MRDPDWQAHLKKIANATLQEGGTAFDLHTCQFLLPRDVWSFPKYPGQTRILPHETDLVSALQDFITANESFLREPFCWLGTWIHPATSEFYLDVATGCEDLQEAIELALETSERDGRRIVALYNSQQKRTVYL